MHGGEKKYYEQKIETYVKAINSVREREREREREKSCSH
jgi:hypothetical protein